MEGNSDQGDSSDTYTAPPTLTTHLFVYQPDPYEKPIERMTDAENVLGILSFFFLLLAITTWACVWYRNRDRQGFRYAMIMFILGAFTAKIIADRSYSNYIYGQLLLHVAVFSLTGYAVLCVVRSVNQIVTRFQVLLCMGLLLILAVLLNGLELLLVTTTGDWDLNGWAINLVLVDIPKMLSLAGGLVVSVVLIYWLFCLDNSKYRAYREYRVIRQSSVCLLLLFVYFLAVEVFDWVQRYHDYDNLHPLTVSAYSTVIAGRDIVTCILLCFLDLEVLALFPCVDLGQELGEETSPLADGTAESTFADIPTSGADGKVHVSSFETEISPRPFAEVKAAYGTLETTPTTPEPNQ